MNKIAGLDVSRNWAIICVLSSFPEQSPTQFFNSLKTESGWNLGNKKKESRQINEVMYRLECNQSGIDLLAFLEVSEIVLEPTGYWYSGFWVNAAKKLGIKINWMSHQELSKSRGHYKFKNKSDLSDALTLALIYFDKGARNQFGEPPFLTNYNHDLIDKVRRQFYEREQLDKRKNSLVSQLKQRLCIEFPEVAEKNLNYIGKKGLNPTLGHFVGKLINTRIPDTTAGTGIGDFSRQDMLDIINYQARILEAERVLANLLEDVEFRPYIKVFQRFGYGVVCQALLLFHCYPFNRFLINGKPYRKGSHDLSLRKFQSYLGLSFIYEASGDSSARGNKVKKKWYGSAIVRAHLYAHALATTCTERIKPKTEVQQQLKESWQNMRIDPQTGEKFPSFKSLGKDGICRLLFYETRLLYQELRKAVR